MVASTPAQIAARSPQRSNGVKRRDAILQAAAEIITELGIAGLTLHAAARKAEASTGSTYHFFRNKEQLLDALKERHQRDMSAMLGSALLVTPAEWKAMTPGAVIDTLFGHPIRYYSDNPYALQLHQLHGEKGSDDFMTLLECVMKWRLGEDRGGAVAKMLYAISTGTLFFVLSIVDKSEQALVHQITAALTAYLAQQESGQN